MKKLIGLCAITYAFIAFAQSAAGNSRLFNDLENLSQAAPNNTTNNPINGASALGHRLYGTRGYRISVCALSGNTLAGAGTVDIYYWILQNNVWSFNKQLQETVNVTNTSCAGAACQCQTFLDRPISAVTDTWIFAAANGVTVSAGTQVNVFIETWSTN